MTLGDVLGIIVLFLALAVSAWALFVAVALLCEHRVSAAMEAVDTGAWKTGFLGLAIVAIGIPLSAVLYRVPGGRLASILLILAILTLAAIGGSAIATIAARRIKALDANVSYFTALSRGAAFVVIPAILPILGWFLLGPGVLVVGVGAGVRSLKARQPAVHPAL